MKESRAPEQEAMTAYVNHPEERKGFRVAIRIYKQRTGCTLQESKKAIDKLIAKWHKQFG